MSSNNEEKMAPPPVTTSGLHLQTMPNIAVPEKTALTTTTAIRGASLDRTISHNSFVSTPVSDRSAYPFDTDIEAFVSNSSIDKGPRKSIQITRSKADCPVWPAKEHLKQRAKAAKRARSCNPLAQLTRRNKIIAKVVIILLVVYRRRRRLWRQQTTQCSHLGQAKQLVSASSDLLSCWRTWCASSRR